MEHLMFEPGTALEMLGRVFMELANEPRSDLALHRLAEVLHDLVSCSITAVWTINPERNEFILKATSTAVSQLPPVWLTYGQGMVGVVAEHRKPLIVSDAARRFTDDAVAQAGFHSALIVPLVWRNVLCGVMGVLDDRAGRTFTNQDVRLTELVAQQAAAIIGYEQVELETQHLRQDLREEQDRLLQIHVAIREMLDQPDAEANLLETAHALQALGWRQVILALFTEEGNVDRLITAGIPDDEVASWQEEIIPADKWQRFLNGDLEDRRLNGLYYVPRRARCPTWDPGDLLFAPLRIGQNVVAGVLRLFDPVNPDVRPTIETLRSADILASQAAYIVENARLLEETSRSAEALAEQVDELSMIHRADRELSAHLNVDRVMTLTMDWALRRTRADTGLLALATEDRRGLVPLITMGHLDNEVMTRTADNPWPAERGIMGRAVQTGITQIERGDISSNDAVGFALHESLQALLAVPLITRGEFLGVIVLASADPDAFTENEVGFLERLARRAAVALDNARLYKQSEQLADDLAVLYSASRAMTGSLDQEEVLQRSAQSMSVALEGSSAVILRYIPESQTGRVLAVYKVGTVLNVSEILPEVDALWSLNESPALMWVIEQRRTATVRVSDRITPEADRKFFADRHIQSVVIAPLVAQGETLGLVLVIEGRVDRQFTSSELFKAEAMASHASIALRQSMLYSEVLELEKLKSEMIRMASHDLRNPLNNVMGYVELVAMSLPGMTPDQEEYINSLRRSTKSMQSLIEDLLTLERIESDRATEWQTFDLGALVGEVVEAEIPSAQLKHHTLLLDRDPASPPVHGSMTQLRQAIANLIGNAIKYTPEAGEIQVVFAPVENRLTFKVVDNGYGISPDRQKRIFQRFYRAREPGTDHIAGTGLGLSLVKMVIERHGGQVWFESEPGQGSTFGFWVPVAS